MQDYFEHMIGKTIEEVGIFNGELVIFLDDESEVCIFENVDGMAIQINTKQELDS